MPADDLDTLLLPVPGDTSAGEDLEYDPAYLAAFRAAEGTPAREMGGAVVAAEEPDWREVRKQTAALLARSKDLRLAVLHTRALLRLQGLAGLRDGLALILGLMETFWDDVYPQLDPDDDNDPTARVNALTDLCDRASLLEALRHTPLIRSRAFGAVSYREIEVVEGRATAAADGPALDAAAVSGAFQDCDLDELDTAAQTVRAALESAQGILAALAARIRTDRLPSLDPLTDLLAGIHKSLRAQLLHRDPGRGGEAPGSAAEAGADPPATAAAGGVPAAADPPAPPGQIAGREDVVRALDRICEYYARREPSSPVPLLLKRARRLVNGSFVEVLRDLAPDAVKQIEQICGTTE